MPVLSLAKYMALEKKGQAPIGIIKISESY
jgi:hypothetical protein